VSHFLKTIAKDQGVTSKTITKGALDILKEYNWTGNIRELRNVVERLVILGSQEINSEDVKSYAQKS
jgi:DNA-binding NtrC family response regulator